jgi:hypothetical protein
VTLAPELVEAAVEIPVGEPVMFGAPVTAAVPEYAIPEVTLEVLVICVLPLALVSLFWPVLVPVPITPTAELVTFPIALV